MRNEAKICTLYKDATFRFTVLMAIIIGLLVHFPVYSQRLTTADGVWNNVIHSGIDWEISLGRWGFALLKTLRFDIVLYSYSAFIGLGCLAIAAGILVKLFDVRKPVFVILLVVCFMCFPSIGALLPLWFCSGDYFGAYLCTVLSVWIVTKHNNKIGILLSVCLFAFSLGVYQAYFSVAASICLFLLIKMILFDDLEIKDVIKRAFKYLLFGISGTITYIFVMKITQFCFKVPPASYAGIDKIGRWELSDIFLSIKNAYSKFFEFYFFDGIFNNSYWKSGYVYLIIFFLFIFLISSIIVRRKIYAKVSHLLLLILFVVLMPLVVCSLEVISPERGIYCLTSESYVVPIVFTIALLELYTRNITLSVFKKIGVLAVAYLGYTYILFTNTGYLQMELNYNKTFSMAIRIINRIEQDDSYTPEAKVLIIGNRMDGNNSSSNYPQIENSLGKDNIATWGVLWPDFGGNQATWYHFMSYYCGWKFQVCTEEEYLDIINTEEYKTMKQFPQKDSIKKINDIYVVKISNLR